MRMINGKTKVLKEITIDNCVISFIEQSNKATDKSIDNLHHEIAKFLLSLLCKIKIRLSCNIKKITYTQRSHSIECGFFFCQNSTP